MANFRQNRMSVELQKEIANIISTEVKDPRLSFVSIISVDVAGDLSYAKVFISVMGDKKNGDDAIMALKKAVGFIRREVGHRMKMRIVPELSFVIDDSIAEGIRMSKIIRQQIEADEANHKAEDTDTVAVTASEDK